MSVPPDRRARSGHREHRRPALLPAAVVAVLTVAPMIGGCRTGPPPPTAGSAATTTATPGSPPSDPSSSDPSSSDPSSSDPSRSDPASTALRAGFTELATTIPARVGVALVPVGGTEVVTLGEWSDGVAWSTIKVPLAIAALRADPAAAHGPAVSAITESNNAAAEQLWSQLGAPDQAAERVQAILRESGDTGTRVESQRLRPGYTAFGQTRWTLAAQARFAARLPCMADTGGVLDLMRGLIAGQRWGLAADGAAAKGGWGPGEVGGYLVRQFAVLSTPAGDVGVAMAAEPHDGSFNSGVSALNQIAQWLTGHESDLSGGHCPG